MTVLELIEELSHYTNDSIVEICIDGLGQQKEILTIDGLGTTYDEECLPRLCVIAIKSQE